MAILTSHVLLLTHSLTAVTTAYLLLTSPSTVLGSHSLWVLGESMHLRPLSLSTPTTSTTSLSPSTSTPSEPLALAALILALSGLTQAFFASGLAPVSLSAGAAATRPKTDAENLATLRELGEKVFTLRFAQNQWMGLAGVRVLIMGALVCWMYLFHSERSQSSTLLSSKIVVSGFGLLANRVVFTFCMMDMLFWGYVWTVLREEARSVMEAVQKRREDGVQVE